MNKLKQTVMLGRQAGFSEYWFLSINQTQNIELLNWSLTWSGFVSGNEWPGTMFVVTAQKDFFKVNQQRG